MFDGLNITCDETLIGVSCYMSLCMIDWGNVFDIEQLYKVVNFSWDYWNWNGKWMNRWMKTDDVWYELYVENVLGWVQEGGELNFERFLFNLDLWK